jgi:predicted PurR-regulated permease PerM
MSDVPTIKLPRQTHSIAGTALTTTVIAVSTVATLYFARDVLVPVALALLLSFVLAPPVRLLQSWYVPRVVAVFVIVAVAFSAIFALGALMVSQVNQLATDLPSYQSTLREKIRSVRGAAAPPRSCRTSAAKSIAPRARCPPRRASRPSPFRSR